MGLISLCKEKQIKGYSGRNKHEIISLLSLQGIESTEENTMNNPTHNPNNQIINLSIKYIESYPSFQEWVEWMLVLVNK